MDVVLSLQIYIHRVLFFSTKGVNDRMKGVNDRLRGVNEKSADSKRYLICNTSAEVTRKYIGYEPIACHNVCGQESEAYTLFRV